MRFLKNITVEELAELPYFEFAACLDICSHKGGINATKQILKHIKMNDRLRILDAGCGIGKTSCYIAKYYNCEVVGIDITKLCIDKAKKLAKKIKLDHKVEFKIADIYSLPFKDEYFDIVITENVFSFIKNKDKALKELIRVTKYGGYIGGNICFRYTKLSYEEKNDLEKISDEVYKSEQFPYTLEELKNLFEKHSLKEIKLLIPKNSYISKLVDYKENISKLKIFLKNIYLIIINKKIRRRLLALNKNYKEINEKFSAGFQIIIYKKV